MRPRQNRSFRPASLGNQPLEARVVLSNASALFVHLPGA